MYPDFFNTQYEYFILNPNTMTISEISMAYSDNSRMSVTVGKLGYLYDNIFLKGLVNVTDQELIKVDRQNITYIGERTWL